MSKEAPIGIFDSGVGGTSIWREIKSLLPYEDTLYLSDSKNAPYGTKGQRKIIELSIKNTEFLLAQNCKIIVVACNTATTNAINYLRAHYNIPFIGIEPAIKPAALNTKTKVIGILATKGTLSSSLFNTTTSLFANGITVIEQIGEGIVELIESGQLHSNEMRVLLEGYLKPMLKAKIDYLVLGCSHYPYLIPMLKELLPNTINIIDSGQAVARQTQSILKKKDLLNYSKRKGSNLFYTNTEPSVLQKIVESQKDVKYLDF